MTQIPKLQDLSVGEMDEKKAWNITFTYHDKRDDFYVETIVRFAPTIVEAIKSACEAIADVAETYKWSDWIVIGANIVPELH